MKKGDRVLYVDPDYGNVGIGEYVGNVAGEDQDVIIKIKYEVGEGHYNIMVSKRVVFLYDTEGRKALCKQLLDRIKHAAFGLRNFGGVYGTD